MYSTRYIFPVKPATPLRVNLSHPLAKYLTACYLANEIGGGSKFLDSTIYANHGTKTGTTAQIGNFGRETVFNGSSDLVTVSYGSQLDPTTVSPGQHRSIIMLARVKSTGGAAAAQNICCRNYDGISNIPYFLGIGGANAANGVGTYLNSFSSTGITTDVRGDGKYHVICGVITTTTGSTSNVGYYYIDGVRDKFASLGSFPSTANLGLKIGSDYNGASNFNGIIESLQIFVGVPIPNFDNGPTPVVQSVYLDNLIADLSKNPYQLLSINNLNINFSGAVAMGQNGGFFSFI